MGGLGGGGCLYFWQCCNDVFVKVTFSYMKSKVQDGKIGVNRGFVA